MASKGTAAKGKKRIHGRLHIRCRRCGKSAYHKIKRICSSCGFGKTTTLRTYKWLKDKVSKRYPGRKRVKKFPGSQ